MNKMQITCPNCQQIIVISDLSEREKEVALYVAKGMSCKDIGKLLYLSESTVKNHLSNTFVKLGIKNKIGLLKYMIKNGYMTIDDVYEGKECNIPQ